MDPYYATCHEKVASPHELMRETLGMRIVLVGGGPDSTTNSQCVRPFVDACLQRDVSHVGLFLAGDARSAERFGPEYVALLAGLEDRIEVVALESGPGDVGRFGALVVGGGPTPVYHSALRPHFAEIRTMVAAGAPYLGFSAGAMIAGEQALLGGYRARGVPVSPVEWSEGLDELTLDDGIGLVPWILEVHAAQAGTLGRAVQLVLDDPSRTVVAVDEDTALAAGTGQISEVIGSGQVWQVRSGGSGQVTVAPRSA